MDMTILIFAVVVVVAVAAVVFIAGTNLNQRLDALSRRLDDGLSDHTEKTGETLKGLHERLAVIDSFCSLTKGCSMVAARSA